MTAAQLIAALRQAERPCRTLDSHLWRLANGWTDEDGVWRTMGDGGQVWFYTGRGDRGGMHPPPQLTGSCDAALTLLEDGWSWSVDSGFPRADGKRGKAAAFVFAPAWHDECMGLGSHPALALCAAFVAATMACQPHAEPTACAETGGCA